MRDSSVLIFFEDAAHWLERGRCMAGAKAFRQVNNVNAEAQTILTCTFRFCPLKVPPDSAAQCTAYRKPRETILTDCNIF